jgi:sulfide dehydrogenase cytochrome subunit
MAGLTSTSWKLENTVITRHLFILAIALSSAAYADNDPAAFPCAECHGIDGIAAKSGIPHLNGQIQRYLQDAMAQFKSASRPGRAFGHEPAGIDDAQVMEVLKRYSAEKSVRPKQAKLDPLLIEKGGEIYQNRCADCHVDNGRESDKEAPLMAAQDVDYLIKQGHHFIDGKRKYPMMMDKSYQGLSDGDLEAVAHFFASQDQLSSQKTKKRRR